MRSRDRRPQRARELLPFQIVIGVTSGAVAGIVAVLGELRDQLGFSAVGIGIIVSAGFLASFVAQIGLAQFADRGHARTMIVSGVTLAAISLMTMTVADDVVVWCAARALLGFATGLTLPGLRRAAAVLDPANVGQNLGRLIVGEILGFLFAPIIAALLVEFGGLRTPFVVFAAALVAFIPFALRLPPDNGRLDDSGRRTSFDLLGYPRLQGSLILIGGYFLMIGAFESVIPVMFDDRGGGPLVVGVAFTFLTLPIVVVSPHAGRVADRVGAPRVAMTGMTIVIISTAFYGVLPGLVLPIALMTVVGVADGFGFTAAQVAVSRSVPENRQAGALGLMGATEVLAAGIGAAPAAVLYGSLGAGPTWMIIAGLSLLGVLLARWRLAGTEPLHDQGADVAWTPIDRHPSPG